MPSSHFSVRHSVRLLPQHSLSFLPTSSLVPKTTNIEKSQKMLERVRTEERERQRESVYVDEGKSVNIAYI